MTKSIQDLTAAELLATASYSAGRLERLADQANAHFVSTSGWLTASLFAINGAGLLAALNIADRLDAASWSASLFGLGIMFAMLNAVIVQELLQASISATEPIIRFWRLIEAGGSADGPLYDKLKAAQDRAVKWGWLAPAMGWISGAVFIAGAIVLAIDASEQGGSFKQTCHRLQDEMLTGRPKGGSSRETFAALGCRFQD